MANHNAFLVHASNFSSNKLVKYFTVNTKAIQHKKTSYVRARTSISVGVMMTSDDYYYCYFDASRHTHMLARRILSCILNLPHNLYFYYSNST